MASDGRYGPLPPPPWAPLGAPPWDPPKYTGAGFSIGCGTQVAGPGFHCCCWAWASVGDGHGSSGSEKRRSVRNPPNDRVSGTSPCCWNDPLSGLFAAVSSAPLTCWYGRNWVVG